MNRQNQNLNALLKDLPQQVPSASPVASPIYSARNPLQIPTFLFAALMFVYSVSLFLPVTDKMSAGTSGTGSKTSKYSTPNIIFAVAYLILSIVLVYAAVKF